MCSTMLTLTSPQGSSVQNHCYKVLLTTKNTIRYIAQAILHSQVDLTNKCIINNYKL